MARRLVELKRRAKAAQIPVIHVNDDFGRWQSNFRTQVEHCLQDGVRGEPIAKLLNPDDDDHFVLKPKHSGFFSTTLDILLEYLGAKAIIFPFPGHLIGYCRRQNSKSPNRPRLEIAWIAANLPE
jgi:nicotinamidase-related amidase